MRKLFWMPALLFGLIVLTIHDCPLHAQTAPRVEEELKALNQSIVEGRIRAGIDRLSAFRQQIDPQKDTMNYWIVSHQLLDLLLQLEDLGQVEQVLKSVSIRK